MSLSIDSTLERATASAENLGYTVKRAYRDELSIPYLVVEDAQQLEYYTNAYRLLEGVRPTKWISTRNLRVLVENFGGQYWQHYKEGSAVKVRYSKDGTVYNLNANTLKKQGHVTPQYRITLEDLNYHADKLGCTLLNVSGKRLTYSCSAGHKCETDTKGFLRKVSGTCRQCSPTMQYTSKNINSFHDAVGFLYVLRIHNDKEDFIKVGITKYNPKYRASQISNPYAVELLYKYSLPIPTAYLLEQQVLKTYKDFKYIPSQHFGGWTECLFTSPDEISWFINKELENVNI